MIVAGLDLHARFWSKVAVASIDRCWPWRAHVGANGYGRFELQGKMAGAHRVSVLLRDGAFPDPGDDVDHLCRNTACPRHLEVVSHQENTRRGVAGQVNGDRQRAITECPKGHPYNSVNTAFRQDGARRCRPCENQRRADYRARTGR